MTKSTGVGRGNNPASWGHHKSGSEHPRWNDGRMINEDGYVKVRVGREHPLADPNGYAYEHLVVWCAAGRPRPGPDETLHHKDECKSNNRLDNLEPLTRGEHNRLHNAERQRGSDGRLLPKTAEQIRWDAANDTSCVGAFARARPGAKP
jgi:hypothetical protein